MMGRGLERNSIWKAGKAAHLGGATGVRMQMETGRISLYSYSIWRLILLSRTLGDSQEDFLQTDLVFA